MLAAAALALTLLPAAGVSAQSVEVAPIAGFRAGGDLFEVAAGRALDIDGAPVLGAAVNVDLGEGLWFEGLFTRQRADVDIPRDSFGPAAHARIVVDQYMAGGRQDFGRGRARPFLTGMLGLTRYAADGDNEVRFSVAAGGGLKVSLQRHLALRGDGRVSTTFVDADARAVACVAGTCLLGVNAALVWQIEFTAGLVVVF